MSITSAGSWNLAPLAPRVSAVMQVPDKGICIEQKCVHINLDFKKLTKGLSQRNRCVLDMLAAGGQRAEIAKAFGLSVSRVAQITVELACRALEQMSEDDRWTVLCRCSRAVNSAWERHQIRKYTAELAGEDSEVLYVIPGTEYDDIGDLAADLEFDPGCPSGG